jgi:hypothetical protein
VQASGWLLGQPLLTAMHFPVPCRMQQLPSVQTLVGGQQRFPAVPQGWQRSPLTDAKQAVPGSVQRVAPAQQGWPVPPHFTQRAT